MPAFPQKTLFQNLASLSDIAEMLNTTGTKLETLLNASTADKLYLTFPIRKKKGGVRIISSPRSDLKVIQRSLAKLLLDYLHNNNLVKRVAHGFLRGRNIATNALTHVGHRYVLNIDLQDFFSSINFGRVYGLFKAPPFGASPEVAKILTQICCHDDCLPQGAPTSPIVSNMICYRLDSALQKLAQKYHIVYTRYADDIAFSKRASYFPPQFVLRNPDGNYCVGKDLTDIILSNGFSVNNDKVHMYCNTYRQSVTGLVVNSKVNVDRRYIKELRAIIHDCKINGCGKAYKNHLKNYKHPDFLKKPKNIFSIIEGKFNFLGMVRGIDDHVRKALQEKYCEINPDYISVMIKENSKIMSKTFFISHASEDKMAIAKPLSDLLITKGISVWLDKYEISLGDSLVSKINDGLINSQYGIVVLSPVFFDKYWPMKELEALFVAEASGKSKRILPLYHGITSEMVCTKFPLIAPKIYWETGKQSTDILADMFVEFLKSEQKE